MSKVELVNQEIMDNNFLKWVVVKNEPNDDHLVCDVFECDIFEYQIMVRKSNKIKDAVIGQVIHSSKVEYNYLSPDGITISPSAFSSKNLAFQFLLSWKPQFEFQGYYSSNAYGKIPFHILDSFVELIRCSDSSLDNVWE